MHKIFLASALFLSLCLVSGETLAQNSKTIKVLTYNANTCRSPSDKTPNIKAIANVIKESKADLIALQEIDVNTKRSGVLSDQAEELAKRTGMYHFFARSIHLQDGQYGIMILSKYPIKESFRIELPMLEKREQRIVAGILVELPNKQDLVFLNTNLDGKVSNRIPQAEGLVGMASQTDLPIILAGDFSAVPGTSEINLLDQTFKRSCPTEDCSGTYPVAAPTRAVSHIMYRSKDQLKVINHEVINEGSNYASDHRPVLAEFELINSIKNQYSIF